MDFKKIVRSSPAFILPSLINLVSLIVLTRVLSLEDYGRLSLALISIEFLQGLFYQWIKMAMMRFYQKENKTYLIASIHYNVLITLLISISIVIVLILSKIAYVGDPVFVSLVLLGTIGRGLVNFILDFVRISHSNLNRYTIVSVVSNACYYFPPLLLLLFNQKASVGQLLTVQTGGIFLYLFVFLVRYFKSILHHIKTVAGKTNYKELFNYGFPLIVSYLSVSMFVRIDRYIIEHNVGLEALGSYSAAFSLSNLAITSFFMLLTLPTYPEILRLLNQGDEKKAKTIYNSNGDLIIMIAVPSVMLAWLINENLCTIFFGAEKGLKISVLFPSIVLGTFLYNYKVHYFDQVFQFYKKTKASMNLGIAVGLSHLLLAFVLSKFFGARGVAYSGIFLNAGAIIFIYYFSRTFFKIVINKKICLWVGMGCGVLLLAFKFHSFIF